ncbi:MAG: hypothetical protein LBG52_00200 [Candidatus Peribacteria bacterium]|jgi:hypothetical protein|nr:hypothetical protein [Candidatus Peribacteria bacterium]
MQKEVQDAHDEGFMTGRMFTEGKVNKEYTGNLLEIIGKNMQLRQDSKKIRTEILDWIKQHTEEDKYVELPLEILIR